MKRRYLFCFLACIATGLIVVHFYLFADEELSSQDTLYEDVLTNSIKTFDNFIYLAQHYLILKEFDKTIHYAHQARLLKEDYIPLYVILGNAYLFKRDYADARSAFEKAYERSYEEVLKFLGTDLSLLEDFSGDYKIANMVTTVMERETMFYTLINLYIATEQKEKGRQLVYDYERENNKIYNKIKDLSNATFRAWSERIDSFLSSGISSVKEAIKRMSAEGARQGLQQLQLSDMGDVRKNLIDTSEKVVLAHLRIIVTACVQFFARDGTFPRDLSQLYTAEIIQDERYSSPWKTPKISGYEFHYNVYDRGRSFSVAAQPIIPQQTGIRYFVTDENGEVIEDENQNGKIDEGEPKIELWTEDNLKQERNEESKEY